MDDSSETVKNNARYHIPNVKRALEVFELLAKHPDGFTLANLARATNYSKSSVFRILCTLEDCGYVAKDTDGRTFKMSRKLAALGYASFGESNIVSRSMDIIRKMRDTFGETSMLGTLLEDSCVLLEQAPGRHPFKFLGEVGMRICLHASAPGKAMLAYLPEEERERKIKRIDFVKFNENTITNEKDFRKELADVRERGFSMDNSEEIEGVRCLGAPVFDAHGYPAGAIWITGPGERVKSADMEKVGAKVREFADEISKRMGYGLI